MRRINISLLNLIFCLAFISCFGLAEEEIIKEIKSPNGIYKIIQQSVGAGATTEQLDKIYLLRSDLRIRKHSNPIFITGSGNIIDVSWKDTSNIQITVLSESLIRYQVVRSYSFIIHVEIQGK